MAIRDSAVLTIPRLGTAGVSTIPETPPEVTARTAEGAFVWLLEMKRHTRLPAPAGSGVGGARLSSPRLSSARLGGSAGGGGTIDGEVTEYFSDRGYISLKTDSIGVRFYAPILRRALNMDRALPLDPAREVMVAAAWGDVELHNPRDPDGVGFWDGIVQTSAVDGREIRVLLGDKQLDRERGIWVDRPYAVFLEVFRGAAENWRLDEGVLTLGLRDSSFKIEKILQTQFYGGTGQADGTAELKGRPLPITRGECLNVTPLEIDSTNAVYQYSNAAGEVLELYERGKAVFANAGDVADLWAAAAPAAGQYKTDNARSLIRLGAAPVGPITADVRGHFPVAGFLDLVADVALGILQEDLGLGTEDIDTASFTSFNAVAGWPCGIYIPAEPVRAEEVVGQVLRSAGAGLDIGRDGRFRVFRLAPPGQAVTAYNDQVIRGMREVDLPEHLTVPNFRRPVGWKRNWTVLAEGDLAPTLTAAERSFLQQEESVVAWFDGTIRTKHLRSTEADRVRTLLLTEAHAQAVADNLGALWGVPRRAFEVDMKIQPLTHALGETIRITFPLGPFVSGARAVVIGETFDSDKAQGTLRVLL